MAAQSEQAPPHGQGGGFQATFMHGGQQHTVHSLLSAADAALAHDVLAVKAALDAAQQPPAGAACSGGDPLHERFAALSLSVRAAATALGLPACARGELVALSFGGLVARLQACADQQGGAACTLLQAAACLGDTLPAQLLLSLEPGLATATDAPHTPLAEAEWALVPAPCPGLGAALLAVLQRSAAQAARLVAHMPAGDVRRLRTAALCLARAQRAHDAPLPQPLVWRVLSLCLAP
ncbi:ankyrin repeat PH and SEC7 domain containing [Micractinium conductrix]|uniref:Ankyrin repeat PH and SEC7 domain containing n=1 Tax=Micractinium conductrix TaxID=554055 RepID=A0A2P6V9P7_9CHLO|nr:ankyrin repeat PH and SEC7 domain containing [Micractinium conductrix]|eukprot:PSC70817.1 ankyrin repeat PH and SEC7 domain containing [Micractinium conductrix]